MNNPNYRAISPNSVRVWRGYKIPKETIEKFHKDLGEVFIPSCIELQLNAGIHSYFPAVTAGLSNKPDFIPDETAVVFYNSKEEYGNCFSKLPVRSYMLNHHAVFAFDPKESKYLSTSAFPVLYKGELKNDVPVYLFEKNADWMYGNPGHFIAELPSDKESRQSSIEGISKILTQIQSDSQIDAAIACIGENYFVYWELLPSQSNQLSGIGLFDEFFTGWKKIFVPKNTSIDANLWDSYPGINVEAGSSFNLQFERTK